ncbi:MAG TPA: UDP-N-acetylglucosamine 2-epimerase (non-hydrolyzing) [Acidimicrobiales bacterium]
MLTVVGTRPEAIKMAPVMHALHGDPAFESMLCLTAQHRELLDEVLELFDLTADFDLGLMRRAQRPVDVLSAVVAGVSDVIDQVQPDWVLVQGDTTTVLGAALAATYQGCRVGHVEAGLRTRDKRQPFPEEINRCATTALADLHFAPTAAAREHLLAEAVPDDVVHVTGNTVIDALYYALDEPPSARACALLERVGDRQLVLLTAHRRENFGAPFASVLGAIIELARRRQDVAFVYPVHPNPAVSGPAHAALGGLDNVVLTEPLDYFTMAHLVASSTLVITDSGGLQEEAPSVGKPVLVLRDVTERPEAVDAGVAKLVGTDRARIVRETMRLLDDPVAYAEMAQSVSPYGDGLAARRIVDSLAGREVKPFFPITSEPQGSRFAGEQAGSR